MPNKPLVLSLALATSTLFSLTAPGLAQSVGGQEISEADWPIVENHCAELAGDTVDEPADDAASDAVADVPTDADQRADQGMPEPMLEEGTTDEPAAENEEIATVDLDTITLEDCQEAGLTAEQ